MQCHIAIWKKKLLKQYKLTKYSEH